MPDQMSFAELAEQHVELLPARTVLSLWRASIPGIPGVTGDQGKAGAKGQNNSSSPLGFLFRDSGSGLSLGDASSKKS